MANASIRLLAVSDVNEALLQPYFEVVHRGLLRECVMHWHETLCSTDNFTEHNSDNTAQSHIGSGSEEESGWGSWS